MSKFALHLASFTHLWTICLRFDGPVAGLLHFLDACIRHGEILQGNLRVLDRAEIGTDLTFCYQATTRQESNHGEACSNNSIGPFRISDRGQVQLPKSRVFLLCWCSP